MSEESVRRIFDSSVGEYEDWFAKNYWVYQTELEAVRKLLPKGHGLEVGVGTGRFAGPLGIDVGVDVSNAMLDVACSRGINGIYADASDLPFQDKTFDFILMVVSICFIDNPSAALKEAMRVLKDEGVVIVGIVDKDTPLGNLYLKKKSKSKFYKYANFFSSQEIIDLFEKTGFLYDSALQCLFETDLMSMTEVGPILPGYGKGGFVVLRGRKKM